MKLPLHLLPRNLAHKQLSQGAAVLLGAAGYMALRRASQGYGHRHHPLVAQHPQLIAWNSALAAGVSQLAATLDEPAIHELLAQLHEVKRLQALGTRTGLRNLCHCIFHLEKRLDALTTISLDMDVARIDAHVRLKDDIVPHMHTELENLVQNAMLDGMAT